MDLSEVNIEVEVVRLDSDIINEHLQTSTAVLHDILKGENEETTDSGGEPCPQCGKYYKNAHTLKMHYGLKHPDIPVEFECISCNKKYSSLLSLQKHMRYMHRYQHRCKACYRTFPSIEMLQQHGTCCRNADVPCDFCGKIFNSRLALKNHIKYKHSEQSNGYCNICRRTFTSARALANHTAAIHPPGATTCGWCERVFNSVPALQSHVLHKHSVDGVRCTKCPKLFKTRASLVRHLKKVHDVDEPFDQVTQITPSTN
ncbi:Zinc finger protein 62-like [Papilio machaon]|uniref:Zinc finger protein 62-like n=1 Tax=Papilio machaon TaxID=76193 RepID=A0A194QUA9_PAPMA|nr:Zinc finger protein 62-like [Papilio machaon]